MQNPGPDDVVPRPPRQQTVLSYLLDYDLTGPRSHKWLQTHVPHDTQDDKHEPLGAEADSCALTPISQSSAPNQNELEEEWELMMKEKQDDQHHKPSHTPANADLRQQFQDLVSEIKDMSRSATPRAPLPTTEFRNLCMGELSSNPSSYAI